MSNNPSHTCRGRVACPLLAVIENPAIKKQNEHAIKTRVKHFIINLHVSHILTCRILNTLYGLMGHTGLLLKLCLGPSTAVQHGNQFLVIPIRHHHFYSLEYTSV